jgi:RNA polymerase sigma factor (sigma-70 family)
MKQDPENGKDTGRDSPLASSATPIFAAHRELLDRLYAESGASSWGLPRDRFESALERGAAKHFVSSTPALQRIEEYLGALHLKDLALASACAEGLSDAWDHFVRQYRVYLRSAAAAILRCPSSSPAAIDLADSLFADLYGFGSGKDGAQRSSLSLFRYFHGRSSLKTWLRAVLAQRHIDAIRANRRFTELVDDDGTQHVSQVHPIAPRIQSLPDPHRTHYVALLGAAFDLALASLDARDRERLGLYYAEQQTLAEIGRALGEHESSVSRNLDRIRRDLRRNVEASLRRGRAAVNGLSPRAGLSEEEIALCFQYASEDAPIDLDKLFPRPAQPPKSTRQQP